LPAFLCPNDNSEMQTVTRDSVELDICPTCRGVWLDRGELDKLLGAQRSDAEAQRASEMKFKQEVDQFQRDPDDWRKRHPWDDQKQRYRRDDDDDDDDRRRGRRRGFDLSDIFDF